MLPVTPHNPCGDPAPFWAQQVPGPSPAKRRRLQEPAHPEALADLEAPGQPLTSVVFLPAGSALQLPLDGVDLLLEPDPASVLEVSLHGHTIILVPEDGLQTAAHRGQPGFSPTSPQEAILIDLPPQDHLVVLQQGCCELILDISFEEDSWDEGEDSDFLEPWMDPPAGQAAGLLSTRVVYSPGPQDPVAEPWPLMAPAGAEGSSPRSAWDLDSYLLGPFPSSPLQPLPPSPPSPQEQRPPHSPRAPCKARRRLFSE
ncbi:proline-rich protein 23A3-like isoform X2 [Acomys russatus]|uniref:proline-rich protein 23A3-like isoform X2 n=1 Tax=Acomys russatus TaxID=60746 RepID=UPI0021E21EE2|nr:proline-rich protein 23A3-like isoform X2 [Acomys russatus]